MVVCALPVEYVKLFGPQAFWVTVSLLPKPSTMSKPRENSDSISFSSWLRGTVVPPSCASVAAGVVVVAGEPTVVVVVVVEVTVPGALAAGAATPAFTVAPPPAAACAWAAVGARARTRKAHVAPAPTPARPRIDEPVITRVSRTFITISASAVGSSASKLGERVVGEPLRCRLSG